MKKILGLLSIALITFACEDPDNVINDVLDNYGTGAVLRTISSSGEYNYNAPDQSVFSLTIEEHDELNGELMQNVEVYVKLNGGSEALAKTLNPSDFAVGPTGLPRTDMTLSLTEVISALGLTSSQYTGGDTIGIRLQLNLTDGRSFSSDSVTGSMTGSYFKSPYAYSLVIKCIPLGAIPGVYTFNLADSYGDGWNNAYITATIDGVDTYIGIPTRWSGYEAVNDILAPLDAGASYASATYTLTIPEGASTMAFSFTRGGDWDSEISFSIDFESLTGTAAQQAYATESNPAEGEKVLSICF